MAKKTKAITVKNEKPRREPIADEIIKIVTNNGKITHASALRNMLRVMSFDNSLFFTSADVCMRLSEDYLKPYPHLQTFEALLAYNYVANVTLTGVYKSNDHGNNSVQRTTSRIQHNNPASRGPKAYGYRFGPAMAAQTIDKDFIDGQKTHSEAFSSAFGEDNIIEGVRKALFNMSFDELKSISGYCQVLMQKRYNIVKEGSDKFIAARKQQLADEQAQLDRMAKH